MFLSKQNSHHAWRWTALVVLRYQMSLATREPFNFTVIILQRISSLRFTKNEIKYKFSGLHHALDRGQSTGKTRQLTFSKNSRFLASFVFRFWPCSILSTRRIHSAARRLYSSASASSRWRANKTQLLVQFQVKSFSEGYSGADSAVKVIIVVV